MLGSALNGNIFDMKIENKIIIIISVSSDLNISFKEFLKTK